MSTTIHTISENILQRFAERLYDEALTDSHIKCTIEIDDVDEMIYRMDFTGVAYYEKEHVADKTDYVLAQIVPTWSEVHAYDEDGEVQLMYDPLYFSKTYLKNIN